MRRILLAEDDDTLATVTSMLLRDEGFEVAVIEDGRQVVGMIASFQPDALVLDLSLGGMNGIVVAAAVRRAWPSLPIIISTGHAHHEGLIEALAEPCTVLLQKPYEIRSLIEIIEQLAKDRSPRR